MEREEHTEEEIILAFTVSDEALEHAADSELRVSALQFAAHRSDRDVVPSKMIAHSDRIALASKPM